MIHSTRLLLRVGTSLSILSGMLSGYVLLTSPQLPGIVIRWPTNNISYYINPTGSGLSSAQTITAVQNAFESWNQASHGAVTFTYLGTTTATANPNDHQNTIFWDTSSSVVPSGALAVTKVSLDSAGNIYDADIAFGTNYGSSFLTPPTGSSCSGGLLGGAFHLGGVPIVWTIGQQGIGGLPYFNVFNADVQATATHEIGHLLGLQHTLVANAVMSTMTGATPGFFCDLGQREPQSDDLSGIAFLYPSAPVISQWTQLSPPTSPSPRQNVAMAYDSARNEVVLFGGFDGSTPPYVFNDTWLWNGQAWAQARPTSQPSNRNETAMAYDPIRQITILFGGNCLNPPPEGFGAYCDDTWAWNGTTWTNLVPPTTPAPRGGHGMAYDAARGQVVMFGGNSYNSSRQPIYLDDTWVWNGSNWVQENPPVSPPPRRAFVWQMAYDPASETVLLAGGLPFSIDDTDVWAWNGSTWTQKLSSTGIEGAGEAVLVTDPSSSHVLMWIPTQGFGMWSWTGVGWQFAGSTANLGNLYQAALVGDVGRNRVILFGGTLRSGYSNATWVWPQP